MPIAKGKWYRERWFLVCSGLFASRFETSQTCAGHSSWVFTSRVRFDSSSAHFLQSRRIVVRLPSRHQTFSQIRSWSYQYVQHIWWGYQFLENWQQWWWQPWRWRWLAQMRRKRGGGKRVNSGGLGALLADTCTLESPSSSSSSPPSSSSSSQSFIIIAIANIIVFLNPHHSLIFATIVIITIFIDIIINNIHNIIRRLKIDFSTFSSFDKVVNFQLMINSKLFLQQSQSLSRTPHIYFK